jgi:hypothetical protein
MTQAQTQTQQDYSAHPNDKRQRSHSFDDHQQQQHHNNRLHHQRDDYRIDRDSRGHEMHDGGNSHWGGARHERGNASEQQQRRTASAIRSPSEEHRFNPYNRQFDAGRIHSDGGHGDRERRNIHHHNHQPHQNEQSPSARSDGRPEEDAEFDENNISDENIQAEEDVEEEEDEEGSEENDEDGRNSKERDGAAKNEDGTCSLTFSMYHNQKPVKVRSMFVDKLFK